MTKPAVIWPDSARRAEVLARGLQFKELRIHAQGFQRQRAPSIGPMQWLLAAAAVLVSASGALSNSISSGCLTTLVVAGISLFLTAIATRNSLRAGLLGQSIMLVSVWVMFFKEAAQSAVGDPSFAVPAYFPLGQGQFDVDVIRRSLLHVCVFQFALLVGYSCARGRYGPFRWLEFRTDIVNGRFAIQALLASCTVVSLGSVYSWNWEAASRAVLGSYRVRLVEDAALMTTAPFLAYLLPIGLYGAAVLFVRVLQTRGLARWLVGICATAAMLLVVLLGGRHYVLLIVVPAAAVALKRFYRYLNAFRALLGVVALVMVFGIFQLQVALRSVGWKAVGTLSVDKTLKSEISGQYDALLLCESLVPAHHKYFIDPTPVYFITHWIPRRFWRDKPVDAVWQYFNDEVTGGDSVWNVTPSVVGQFYMSLGAIGVGAIGCCLGMLCRIADNLFAKLRLGVQQAPAVFAAMLYVLFINSLRLVSPFYLVYNVAAFAGMIVLTRGRNRVAPV